MIALLKTLPVVALVFFGVIVTDHTNLVPALTRGPVLAAEGTAPGPNVFTIDWQSVLGTLGVTGVLVWYLWYTTSAAFPKIRDDFRQEMAAERDHHVKMQEAANQRVDKVCESIDSLSEELRTKPCLLGKIPGVNS